MQKGITEILVEVSNGSKQAYHELFSSVYDELKKLANRQLFRERKDHTYSQTALVHEVYLKMADKIEIDWKGRTHFYGVAAICMKQLLVDYARKRLAQKRGGNLHKQTYIDEIIPSQHEAKEIINLDQALQKLKEFDSRMAEVVDYRYFGGLTIKETAEVMGISKNTVKRDWAKARGLLFKEIQKNFE